MNWFSESHFLRVLLKLVCMEALESAQKPKLRMQRCCVWYMCWQKGWLSSSDNFFLYRATLLEALRRDSTRFCIVLCPCSELDQMGVSGGCFGRCSFV